MIPMLCVGAKVDFFLFCILQALVHNPNMIENYTHIVLDEVHECSTDADFVMLVVRTLPANAPRENHCNVCYHGYFWSATLRRVFDHDQVASPYFVGTKRYST